MYGILSTDKRNITRAFKGNSTTFKSGDFAFDNLEIGTVTQLNLYAQERLEEFGIVRIELATWNKQTEVASEFGYEKKGGGYLKIVDGVLRQTAVISPKSFEGPKVQLRDSVNSKRDSVQDRGIIFFQNGIKYAVDTDPKSRDLLNGSVNLANEGGWIDGIDFWTVKEIVEVIETVDGEEVSTSYLGDTIDLQMTGEQIKALGVAVGNHVKYTHGASRIHKQSIDALGSLESVLAYDLEAGWPENAPVYPLSSEGA